jgi:hypothetical protein
MIKFEKRCWLGRIHIFEITTGEFGRRNVRVSVQTRLFDFLFTLYTNHKRVK